MLRSSRHGRREAARFHVNGDRASNLPSFPSRRIVPLPIARRGLFETAGPSRSTSGRKMAQDQHRIVQSQVNTPAATEDTLMSTPESGSMDQSIDNDTLSVPSTLTSANLLHVGGLFNAGSEASNQILTLTETNTDASEKISSTSGSLQWHATATANWSRDTSVEVHSLAGSSALSSPPSDQDVFQALPADKDGTTTWPLSAEHLQSMERLHGDGPTVQPASSLWDLLSDTSTLTQAESTPRLRRTRKQRSSSMMRVDGASDDDRNDSMVSNRPKRSISKSLKQLEAEETMALTPSRRRSSTPRVRAGESTPATPLSQRTSLRRKRALSATSAGPATESKVDQEIDEVAIPRRGISTRRSSLLSAKAGSTLTASISAPILMEAPLESEPTSVTSTPTKKPRGRPKGTTKAFLQQRALDRGETPSRSSLPASKSMSAVESMRKLLASSDRADTPDSTHEARRSTMANEPRPLWKRKVFLTSGLYSNDHKHNETVKVPTRKSLQESHHRLLQGTSRTRSTNRTSAFPLPADFGHWVLTAQRDFRLTYPYHQEVDEIRQKMASKRIPPPYKHISTNKYVSRPKLPGEIMVCQCPPTGTCDESCVNRQTQYLCHPKYCPCGDRCTNIQFGKRKPIKTEVQWYGSRGFGLRTKEPIAANQFVDEYRGEVINYNEMVRRVRDHYKDTGNYYFLMYDAPAGEMLDGGLKGNITRYANHSCDPNCGIQKWLVCGTDEQRAGEFQVALFALRDIAAGEELTYDYGWSAFSPKTVSSETGGETEVVCHCGAATCSGVMGVRKNATLTKVSTSVKGTGKGKGKGKDGKRRRSKKRRQAIRVKTAQFSAPQQREALQSLSESMFLVEGKAKQSIQLPEALLSLIPEPYRTGDSIHVSTDVLEQIQQDLKADLSSPLDRKKWERAIVLGIESHIEGIKAQQQQGTDADSTVAAERSTRSRKRKAEGSSLDTQSTHARATKRSKGEVVVEQPKTSRLVSLPSKPRVHRAPKTLVRDRVTRGIPQRPSQLIDSDNVPIIEGKRTRRPATPLRDPLPITRVKGTATVSSPRRIRLTMTRRPPVQDEATTSSMDESWNTTFDHGEATGDLSSDMDRTNTTESMTIPYDLSRYPPGTQFFTRAGKLFDFAIYKKTRRGKKPRPYTQQELDEANEHHRRNLKRLNDLRKFR